MKFINFFYFLFTEAVKPPALTFTHSTETTVLLLYSTVVVGKSKLIVPVPYPIKISIAFSITVPVPKYRTVLDRDVARTVWYHQR